MRHKKYNCPTQMTIVLGSGCVRASCGRHHWHLPRDSLIVWLVETVFLVGTSVILVSLASVGKLYLEGQTHNVNMLMHLCKDSYINSLGFLLWFTVFAGFQIVYMFVFLLFLLLFKMFYSCLQLFTVFSVVL
jgi:hypothetical protein